MQLVRRFLFSRLYIIIILIKSVEAVKKTASIAVYRGGLVNCLKKPPLQIVFFEVSSHGFYLFTLI
jgi:hypothetical protein